jgi:hypothetical protein
VKLGNQLQFKHGGNELNTLSEHRIGKCGKSVEVCGGNVAYSEKRNKEFPYFRQNLDYFSTLCDEMFLGRKCMGYHSAAVLQDTSSLNIPNEEKTILMITIFWDLTPYISVCTYCQAGETCSPFSNMIWALL